MIRGPPSEGYLPPQHHPTQGYPVEYYVPQSPTAGYVAYAPPPPSNVCHFFNTVGGCRKGNACPFLHVSYEQPSFAPPPMMSPEEFYYMQQQEFLMAQSQYYGVPPMSPPPHMTSPVRHPVMPESVSSPPPPSTSSESPSESDSEEMSIEQRLFLAAQRYERERMNSAHAASMGYQH